MWIIFKKELNLILNSSGFYFLLFMCTLVWGATFSLYLFQYVESSLLADTVTKKYNFHNTVVIDYIELMHIFLMILISPLAARLFTQEKKQKTLDWLLIHSLKPWQVLLGKYFALLSVCYLMILVGLGFPASTSFFGEFQWGPLATSSLGLFLLFGIYVASSVLVSLSTSSMVLSMVGSFIVNILILVLGSVSDIMPDGMSKKFFEYISTGLRFNDFKLGIINSESVFYMLSFALVLLFLSHEKLKADVNA